MMGTVVNLRDFHVPDSRRPRTWPGRIVLPPDVVRIDRRSAYGNPHRIGELKNCDCVPVAEGKFDRESAIAAYRVWLADRLRWHPSFLEPLRGKHLACWCAPEPCHGDVIVELLEREAR